MSTYTKFKTSKGLSTEYLTILKRSTDGQIHSTALKIWWNHVEMLLLSIEVSQKSMMEELTRESECLMWEDPESPAKVKGSWFQYKQWLARLFCKKSTMSWQNDGLGFLQHI